MTKDEALKLALEALEDACGNRCNAEYNPCFQREAITAIKESLAQPEQDGQCKRCTDGCPACDARKLPEQEPVAWAKFSAKGNIIDLLSEPDDDYTSLYTTPPQRKPLTDEEIAETLTGYRLSDAIDITRAIEAAHGIKG